MRVVLDTNTVLSAVIFPRERLAWMVNAWKARRFLPLMCTITARELIETLAYPKFKLTEQEISTLLATYLPFAEVVDLEGERLPALPPCADPDDQIFLRVAAAGRAEALVTGDRALLDVAERITFAIESPATFRKRFFLST